MDFKENPAKSYIYALRDPETGEIRYVGKSVNPEKRLAQHLDQAIPNPGNEKEEWLAALVNARLEPELEILDEAWPQTWKNKERYWIERLRRQGCDLLNRAPGGIGGGPREKTRKLKQKPTIVIEERLRQNQRVVDDLTGKPSLTASEERSLRSARNAIGRLEDELDRRGG